MIRFPKFIVYGRWQASIKKSIERSLDIMVILTMLFSSLSIPVRSVTAASMPFGNLNNPVINGQSSVLDSIDTQKDLSAVLDDSLPKKRPVVEHPEPRKGVRPQSTLPAFPDTLSQVKSKNGSNPSVVGPAQPLPLMFIENVGQFDPDVKFQIKGLQDTIHFNKNEFWVTSYVSDSTDSSSISGPSTSPTLQPGNQIDNNGKTNAKPIKGVNLKFEFVGQSPDLKVEGIDKLDTSVSFFEGNDPTKWRSNVPVWTGVRYVDIYPGVDLEVKSQAGIWSWQLVVKDEDAFGSSISKSKAGISLRIQGAKTINLDQGNLSINSEAGNILVPVPNLNHQNEQKAKNSPFALSAPTLVNNELVIVPPGDASPQELTATSTPASVDQITPTAKNKSNSTPVPAFTSTTSPVVTETQTPNSSATPVPTFTNTPSPVDTETPTPNSTATSVSPTETQLPVTITSSTPIIVLPDSSIDSKSKENYPGDTSSRYLGQVSLVNYHPVANGASSLNSLTTNSSLALPTTDLTYSTYLQGGFGFSIAVDSLGAMYITGNTNWQALPVSPGAFQEAPNNGDTEIFIQKLNPAGDQSIYATYLGGTSQDSVNDIKIDRNGSAYITGFVTSNDFPTTPNAYDTSWSGLQDVFVTKLNSTGTSLEYSTYLGGTQSEQGFAIAINFANEAIIVGQTNSADFPATAGAYSRIYHSGVGNYYDGFATKLNSTGSALVYSTFFGGTNNDCEIYGIYPECTLAIDSAGAAYIAGPTASSDFPTTPGAYNRTFSGNLAAFVMKLKPDGSGLFYSTFLGGTNENCNTTCPIAVDPAGSAYITGVTNASDFPHSTYGTYSSGWDTFLVKLNPGGSVLDYSMLIGGTGDDIARDIVVDEYGFAYVVGETNSVNFPTSTNAYQQVISGGSDSFILKASPDGAGFTYSSYLGGTSNDWGMGDALGRDRQVYIIGGTLSNNFPATPGAFRSSGFYTGFVSKFDLGYYTKVQDLSSLCYACRPDEIVGDPILTRIGAFTESFDYLPISTRAGNLAFTSWYSSSSLAIDRYSTLMGYGWTNNHDIRLIFPTDAWGEDGYILVKSGTADQIYFIDNGDGTYSPDAGVTSDLVKHDGPPITYTLTDASQNVYTFDADGKITTWKNALGFYWSYSYDISNRLHRVTDDTGLRYLEFTYDTQNRIQSVTDHTGRSITLGYDTNGDLDSLIDPLTHTWTYTYDNLHHLRLVTDPGNTVVIHTEYDANGRAFQQYDSQGTLLLSILYNEDGTTQITNSVDGVTTHDYGNRNTLNSSSFDDGTVSEPMKMYDPNFRPVAITDGNSKSTELDWNITGVNLSTIVDPEDGQTDLTYNSLNSLTSVIDARDNLTTFIYAIDDPDPNRHTLLIQSEDAMSNVTQYEYTTSGDAPQPSGLLKRIIGPDNQITSFTYDQFGQLLTTTDPQNKITTKTYDELGRVKSIQDPLGQVSWTCYDAIGRVIRSVANATGDGTTPQSNPCDAQNYLTSVDPQYDRISLAYYDLSGNIIGTVDQNGIVTRTFFDDYDRPQFVTRNLRNPQNPNATPAELIQLSSPPSYDPAYPDRNVTTETRYDQEGNVIATIDEVGVITRTFYDAYNRPIFVTQNIRDPFNPTASVDELLEITAAPAFDSTYPDRNLTSASKYDTAGNLIATVDPLGRITRTYYDGNNRQRFVVQNLTNYDFKTNIPPEYNPVYPDQNVRTETLYDAAGNPIINIDPNGTVTRSCFDALGRVERTVINPSGDGGLPSTDPCDGVNYVASQDPDVDRITDTIFDGNGNVIATIDPIGIVTRNYYDSEGRQIAVTQNLRDPANLEASISELLLLSEPPVYNSSHQDWNITTKTIYDASTGLVIATINPEGIITRTYYDSLHRPYLTVQDLTGQTPQEETPPVYNPTYPDQNIRTETVYNADGTAIAVISNDGVVNRTYYDDLGRPFVSVANLTDQDITVATPPVYNPDYPDQNVQTQTFYDGAGRVMRTIDPVGKVTFTCFDAVGRGIKTVINPTVDNPCESYTLSTDTDTDITIKTISDGVGNQRVTIDASGNATYFQYDDLNRMIEQADPLNHQTKNGFDAVGNQVSKTDGKNVVTRYEYDALGELTAVVENYVVPGSATNEQNVRTEYTYDKMGNRKTIKDALNHVTSFTYDGLGRLSSEQDALSHETSYGYDAVGNKISVLDANGATTSYTYDDVNRLVAIDFPAPDVDVAFAYDVAGNRKTMTDETGMTQWDYDQLNRPTAVEQPVTGIVHYDYNGVGNRTQITYPDTKVVDFTFDDAGRLHMVTDWDNLITTYTYDRADLLHTRTLPNAVASNYSYDVANHLQSLTHTLDNQTLASYSYIYDENGNRLTAADSLSTGGNPPDDLIFEDGFESGDTSAWSYTSPNNRVSVTNGGAIVGNYGMVVTNIPYQDGSMESFSNGYVSHQNPSAVANYNARFYFDPNSIYIPSGETPTIFTVVGNGEQIQMRFSSGDHQLRSMWADDANNISYSPWFPISDDPHAVELDWHAATGAGLNDGSISFFIDDVLQSSNYSIDNDTLTAGPTIKLGCTFASLTSKMSGTEYFDEFKSSSTTHIGLDPNGPPVSSHSTEDPIFSDDFESNNLATWSQAVTGGGDLSVSASSAIVGTYGLQAVINDSTLLYVTDWTPFEETRYRGRFYFDPNSIHMADGGSFNIFQADGPDDAIVSTIELRFSAGDYQVRGSNLDDSGSWDRTAWFTITDSPHAIELDWQAASISGANDGNYSLWIDGTQQANLIGLDNDAQRVNGVKLGVLTAPSATTGTLYFDAFVSHRNTLIDTQPGALPPAPPPDLNDAIFSDNFESGTLAGWSNEVDPYNELTLTSEAKVIGNNGIKVQSSYTYLKYLVDWSPFQDKQYRARFYFDPNTATVDINSPVQIFNGYSRDLPALRIALQRIYVNNVYQYQLRSESANDLGYWNSTPWITITDNFHAVEIQWNAASGLGNNNGVLNFWVDGNLRASLNSIDNDTFEIDSVKLGAIAGLINMPGSIFFDEFISRRNTYIGVDSSIPNDAIFADGFESGDLTIWSSSITDGGDLTVGYQQPILGSTYELQATINDNNPLYVVDQTPNNEPRYRARFYFEPNSISMAEGDSFYLFQALDASSMPNIRIEFRYQSGSYQVRSQAIDDEEIWNSNPWTNINDTHHAIEIDWQAASAIGANNGSLTFWVDDNKLSVLSNIDNDTLRVKTVQMGAVDQIDNGTRGTFYMDGFESRRSAYIGLDSTARPHVIPIGIFADSIESGDFSAWSTQVMDGGHLSVSVQAAMVGNNGIQAVVSDNNPLYLEDWTPHAEKSYNARFYFNPNGFTLSNSDVITLFNLIDAVGALVARVKFRIFNGDYQVMAEVLNDSSNWAGTSWIGIANQQHAIELDWLAATAQGANNGSLTLTVDNLAGLSATLSSLDNDVRLMEDVQLGVIAGISNSTRGTMFFDAFASQRANMIGLDPNANPVPPAPDALFADGFESGDLSAWSTSQTDNGHLSVTSQAAIIGTKGLQADLYGSSTQLMYVNDWSPYNESQYRVRFYFDPNSVSMSQTDTIEIFAAYNQNDDLLTKVEMQFNSEGYQINATILDNGNVEYKSNWIRIIDAPHAIEIYWQAATGVGANNGSFTFWVDGIQRANLTGINNDSRLIDFAHLGVKLIGTPDVQGTVYFDGLESRRNTYIGLDGSVPAPTLFSDGFEADNMAAWSGTTGDGTSLAVTTDAAIVGNKGLKVTVDDNNDNYVYDSKVNNEKRYRVRFYFDPNTISMANNDSFLIFNSGDEINVEFRFSGGDYQVRSTTVTSYGNYYSPWVTITDDPHALELDWKASSSSYNPDGYLNFWVDGTQVGNITSVPNFSQSITKVEMGAFLGIRDSDRGSLYFDAFESRYLEYIGVDPNVSIPPAPTKGDALFADGFESGDLSAWAANQTDSGHLSVTSQAAIIGTEGLQASLYGSGTNIMYVNDWKPWDESHYRVRFYFDPNSVSMSQDNTIEIFAAYNRNGDLLTKVEVQYNGGNYQVDATILDDVNWEYKSSWINISDAPHAVEIDWQAATGVGANNGSMAFWVDGIQRANITLRDNDSRLIDYAHLGVKLVGTPNIQGTVYFDGFESHRETYIGLDPNAPIPQLFSDGFESGNLSAWSGNVPDGGSLTVTTGAAIVGDKGLQTAINDNNDKYVYDNQLSNEPRYRVRFYFDPNSLSMANMDSFTLFTALNQATIDLRYAAGDYQVRSSITNDASAKTYSPWITITDGPHALELDWNSSSAPGANDGYLTFWVDSEQQGNITGIDNDTRRVTSARMGAFSGIDSGTRGNIFFDAFESRYTEYIGLDPNALTPPAPPTKTDTLFADGFESGGLTNWAVTTTTGGDLSVQPQAAVTGTYGLKVLQDDTTADYVTDYRPIDESQYRMRFYLQTNGITLVENMPLYIFYVLNREGSVVARIALQNSSGDYQVKAEAVNDAGSFTTASTSWVKLWNGLHAIEINWQAASGVGANDGVLTLWVDDTQQATFTNIDNDLQRVDQAQLGAISGMNANNNGTLYFDLFESRRSSYIGLDGSAPTPQTSAPDLIYANGLESGNFVGWSSTNLDGGHLSVTAGAKLAGNYGLQAYVNDNTSLYVTDKRPSGETQYRARFYFDPNGITMADGNAYYLFYGMQGTSSPTAIFRLEVRRSLGDYQVRLSAIDDATAWTNTTWYTFADQLHYFELNWQAATTTGANNGVISLWIDGTQKESISTLDNDTRRVDQIQWGGVSGIDTGTRGTEYLDVFESHRTGYIGPDANAPTPPAPPTPSDAVFSDGFEGGNLNAWSANAPDGGHLSVTTAAKLVGNYGLSAYINDNTALSVTDWTPSEEGHYRAQFRFHPNGITMATNNAHYIFYALSFDGLVVARIEFGKIASGYQIRASAVTDASSSTFTDLAWTTGVTNAAHKIEIEWQAASAPGANDGVLTLWLDGTQVGTVTNLDNDTRRVNAGQMGPVAGIDTGTRGTEYFDAFVSRRSSYIGLVAPSGVKVAQNDLPEPTRESDILPVVYRPSWLLKPWDVSQMTGLADAPRTITYAYDPLGRLISANYGDGNYFVYTYDAVGRAALPQHSAGSNRLSERTQFGTTTYTYDAANRLATVNAVSYTWDDNGNLLSDGVSTYTYTNNKLSSITSGTQYITFQYNGLGDRVSQTVNGLTTHYTLDLNAGLTQVLADGTNTYLYGYERIAQFSASETGYFLGDALGSVRQMTDASGAVMLMRNYEPFGSLLNSYGNGESLYGYTGEQADSTGLIFLRSRYYSSQIGRFLSKDTWRGDNFRPLSLNSWNYVTGNPVNRIDPLGLWELAPGFNLSEGGIFGKGVLEMQGSPIKCKGTCVGPASTKIPIFVPPVVGGKLYNDQYYGRYGYTDIRMIKHWIEYDILQKRGLTACYSDEVIVPKNTDDWKVVYQTVGKSYAFSQGAWVDLTVAIGLGMGYDSGFSPIDMTMNPVSYYSNNLSIAFQLFAAQSKVDRERLNLIEVFEESGNADKYEARVGGTVFLAQGIKGLQAFNSRTFTITVQEHKHVPTFYRSIIETNASFQEVKSRRNFVSSYFLSYENGSWREQLFNLASSH